MLRHYDAKEDHWETIYTCPRCDTGKGMWDGCLGRLVWLTCDYCGWDFSIPTQKYIDEGGQLDE